MGGGQRPFSFGLASTNYEDFSHLAVLLGSKMIRPVVDEIFAFELVPEAYQKLRTGHAKGKIVVLVKKDIE